MKRNDHIFKLFTLWIMNPADTASLHNIRWKRTIFHGLYATNVFHPVNSDQNRSFNMPTATVCFRYWPIDKFCIYRDDRAMISVARHLISPLLPQLHQLIEQTKHLRFTLLTLCPTEPVSLDTGSILWKWPLCVSTWDGLWYEIKQFHTISMGICVVWETSAIGTITNLVLHASVPRSWCRFGDGLMQKRRNASVLAMELRLA